MVWPFFNPIRKYMRMAAYWLGKGWTQEEVEEWAGESRHYYDVSQMRPAIPEAARSRYFAEYLRSHRDTLKLSQAWFTASQQTFRAGYGRAPTAAERSWAYSQPQESLGLMFRVTGYGAETGSQREFTVTLNAAWSATMAGLIEVVKDCVSSGSCITGEMGTEPLERTGMEVSLVGGALISRQSPTIPGVVS